MSEPPGPSGPVTPETGQASAPPGNAPSLASPGPIPAGTAPPADALPADGRPASSPDTSPAGGAPPALAPPGATPPALAPPGAASPASEPPGTGPAGRGQPAGAAPRPRRLAPAGGWPLSRLIWVSAGVIALFSVLAIIFGALTLTGLTSARQQLETRVDPAALQALRLQAAMINQETGVRGYVLSGQRSFLVPYTAGHADQQAAVATLRPLVASLPAAAADLARVNRRIAAWQTGYAEPTIRQIQAGVKPALSPSRGKAYFDALRVSLTSLQNTLDGERLASISALNRSEDVLAAVLIAAAVGLLLVTGAIVAGLRQAVIRPVSRLAAEARQVSDGDFSHQVSQTGPAEVRALGADVNLMRERILAELSAVQAAHADLAARTRDLQRSNAELEQFAYVASHDLQEPLRKVASFCQLLQARYAGQLDERADQYIEHAVDGAKRMQALINDLLAFSRVGRTAQKRVPVPCAALLAQAWANLATVASQTQVTIEAGDLPVVLGEASLLTAVFQNLLSNALKFRSDHPPHVVVSARRDGGFWLFTFADNGIGIEPEYAERIFVIFQRLHDRVSYPGTGIGLAMCRKIVEYHGGKIWLDTTAPEGARFCFTLPALPEDPVLPGDKDTHD